MARHIPRLFIDEKFQEKRSVTATKEQYHHLINVMRCKNGEEILLFNGIDGEWKAQIALEKKHAVLKLKTQSQEQTVSQNIQYWFAPLKKTVMDSVVEKSVELGVKTLRPIITEFTQNRKIDEARMRNQTIQAAQQCGILTLPEIMPIQTLDEAMQSLDPTTPLLFCDENAEPRNPLDVLGEIQKTPVVILVGPEGGFSENERDEIKKYKNTKTIWLGPRTLRADTAAFASITLVQASIGDWKT